MDAWDLRDDFSAAEVATVIDSQETCGQEVEFRSLRLILKAWAFIALQQAKLPMIAWMPPCGNRTWAGAKRSLPTLAPPVDPVTPLRSP